MFALQTGETVICRSKCRLVPKFLKLLIFLLYSEMLWNKVVCHEISSKLSCAQNRRNCHLSIQSQASHLSWNSFKKFLPYSEMSWNEVLCPQFPSKLSIMHSPVGPNWLQSGIVAIGSGTICLHKLFKYLLHWCPMMWPTGRHWCPRMWLAGPHWCFRVWPAGPHWCPGMWPAGPHWCTHRLVSMHTMQKRENSAVLCMHQIM